MKALTSKLLATAALVLAVSTGTASANTDQVGANARLAFSDKLSMYGQRIVGSACAHTLEKAPFESRGFLAVAGLEINRILDALEKGDRALGIPTAEENDRILELIREMKVEWILSQDIAKKVLAGQANEKILAELEIRNKEFMDIGFDLVAAISNQYTDTESLQLKDSIRLQVAGRQRMLSQKLSYEACNIQKGNGEAREALTETLQMYELSANALLQGMPEVGMVPTTDPALVSALGDVDKLWTELKWPLMALKSGAKWDTTTQARMYLKLNELMHEMDKVVVAYTKAANSRG